METTPLWYESVKRKGINLKSNPAPVRPQDFSRPETQSVQRGGSRCIGNKVGIMVLILDGNSEMGAHVRNNSCNLTCLRHLNRSRADPNQIFFSPKRLNLHYGAYIRW